MVSLSWYPVHTNRLLSAVLPVQNEQLTVFCCSRNIVCNETSPNCQAQYSLAFHASRLHSSVFGCHAAVGLLQVLSLHLFLLYRITRDVQYLVFILSTGSSSDLKPLCIFEGNTATICFILFNHNGSGFHKGSLASLAPNSSSRTQSPVWVWNSQACSVSPPEDIFSSSGTTYERIGTRNRPLFYRFKWYRRGSTAALVDQGLWWSGE